MAQQDLIKLTQNEEYGLISIKKTVFDSIASLVVSEEKRAVLENKSAITSKIVNNDLYLKVDIKLLYGQNVQDVSESLQQKINRSIHQMTGLETKKVDINIVGFVFNA